VSPGHRLVWQNAFRLQHLLIKQQYFRFENLERLGKGWAVTEEATLKESLPLYEQISSEIEDIKSKWLPLDKDPILTPFSTNNEGLPVDAHGGAANIQLD
jgi:hypothetical protein